MKVMANPMEPMIATLERIPPLPAIVLDLMQSLDDENANIAQLARKIGLDPPLTARVLRVVNSPFYGMQGQISSVQEAVMVLGFSNIRSLAMAASLSARYVFTAKGDFDAPGLWEHSFSAALCCRLLSRQLRLSAETAFTAGLLHDIGRIGLLMIEDKRIDEIFRTRAEKGVTLLNAEREVLGYDHAQLGARLLERWRLPAAVVQAVERHHSREPDPTDRLADLVIVGDSFAIAHRKQQLAQPLSSSRRRNAMVRLSLSHSGCIEALAPMPELLKAVSSVLHET